MPTSRIVLLLDDHLPATDEIWRGVDPALHAQILTGSSVEELATALSNNNVEFVILGAGLPSGRRHAMMKRLLDYEQGPSIHIQSTTDGHSDIVEFANGVMTGLAWHQWDWSRSLTASESPQSTPPRAARPQTKRKRNMLRRIWDYVFGRSEPPVHPPPPPYSPGAGI